MNDWWYIQDIEANKRGNMDIFNNTLVELYGRKLTWNEVKQLPKDMLVKLCIKFKNNITKEKSLVDINKLKYAIQNSRSGMGGAAMTEFECAFCGEKEMWSNTNVPNICKKCAGKMAESIVLNKFDILK